MEAIKIFLKNEIKDNMFEREIFGIKYWEYVRPFVCVLISKEVSNSESHFAKVKQNLKMYFPYIKRIKNYFLRKRRCDILMVSYTRRMEVDNKYRNNCIDYYVDYLKEKYNVLTIEEPTWSITNSNYAHKNPVYTENIYFTDFHEIKLLLKYKFNILFKTKKYKQILEEYEKVSKTVAKWYGKDKVDFKEYFIKSILKLESSIKYSEKLLLKTKPKLVMFYYMPSVFTVSLAANANKMNIPTVEVQHGTISKYDPVANKCLDASKLKGDIKYIFAFGKNQVNTHALAMKDLNKIKCVGYPYFEEKIKSLKLKEKDSILIISQATIGESMAKFASELADIIKDKKIIFKYHPHELTKDYECLKKDNIIEIRSEKSIYELQEESMLQIGSYSTSVYEGFAFKIPTLIVKKIFGSSETIDMFKDIKKGIYFIDEAKDVLRYMDRNDIIPVDDDIEKLWVFDSKKKILKEVKNIIDEVK